MRQGKTRSARTLAPRAPSARRGGRTFQVLLRAAFRSVLTSPGGDDLASDANQGRTAAEPFDEATGEVLEPLPTELSPAIAAEINQQVATAKRYPRRRDLDISQEIRGRAALTEDIASECMYTLARDHKTITGPSIRFAEIVRASYGNIRVAARFVRIDADDPMRCAVIVEAVAFDLQSNTAEVIPVRRSIMTSGKAGKQARMFSADDHDLRMR